MNNITCPQCKKTSYSQGDIDNKYCVACNLYHDDMLINKMKSWCAEKGWEIGDDIYISHKLMYHYALLINPHGGGYEQRYCYKDLDLLVKAVEEFQETGKLRYWHKDHSNNLSVVGSYLYEQGHLQTPENSCGQVDWVVE